MAYNSSQEFFLSLVPIQKEDEYKFISYLFHNPDEIHTVLQEQLFDETSIKLYGCIKSILSNNLKVERDILFECLSCYRFSTFFNFFHETFCSFGSKVKRWLHLFLSLG